MWCRHIHLRPYHGVGVADQIRDAMMREGFSREDATGRFWLVDRQGLLTADMSGQLRDYQSSYARSTAQSKSWHHSPDGSGINLAEVVRRVNPTMLIGASAESGAFTQAIVEDMASHTERPISLVLSIPQAHAEAIPADLVAWTGGRALIATGRSFSPVTYKVVTYAIAQLSNAMLYPGLALGAIISQASRISEGIFAAAANAVSSLVILSQSGASLLPHVDDLRCVSMSVAAAVAEAALAEGLARVKLNNIHQQVKDAMWQPEYREIRAV